MKIPTKYGPRTNDEEWGCEFIKILCNSLAEKVYACHVKISEIEKIATELTKSVQDTSWIMSLDEGTQRSYNRTASETAQELVEIFKKVTESEGVAEDFGELMVSISSSKALEKIFDHCSIPIAELWKPQLKQNEGFDFHTVCPEDLINFGEAKYSYIKSPHGEAISQAEDFLKNDKHYRDRVHLTNLVSNEAIQNLDSENFGVVAAFSVNAANPLTVFKNAINKTKKVFPKEKIGAVYLVGVTY